jgi:hypothetical protein
MATQNKKSGRFVSTRNRNVFTETSWEVTVPSTAFDLFQEKEDISKEDLAYGAKSEARTRVWLDWVAPGYLDSFNGAVTAKTQLSTLSGGVKLMQELHLQEDAAFQDYLSARKGVYDAKCTRTALTGQEAKQAVNKLKQSEKKQTVKNTIQGVGEVLSSNVTAAMAVGNVSARAGTNLLNALAGKQKGVGKAKVGGYAIPLNSTRLSYAAVRKVFNTQNPSTTKPVSFLRWDKSEKSLYRSSNETPTETDGALYGLLVEPHWALQHMITQMTQTEGALPRLPDDAGDKKHNKKRKRSLSSSSDNSSDTSSSSTSTSSNSSSSSTSSSTSSTSSSTSSTSSTSGSNSSTQSDLTDIVVSASVGGDGTPALVTNRNINVYGMWLTERHCKFFLKGRSRYIPLLLAWGGEGDCRAAAPFLTSSLSYILNHPIMCVPHGVQLRWNNEMYECSDNKFAQLNLGVSAGTSQQRCPKCSMKVKSFDKEHLGAAEGFTNYNAKDIAVNVLSSFHTLERHTAYLANEAKKKLTLKQAQKLWKDLCKVNGCVALPMLFSNNARAREELKIALGVKWGLSEDASQWPADKKNFVEKKYALFLDSLDLLDDTTRKGQNMGSMLNTMELGFLLASIRLTPALAHGLNKLGKHILFDWLFRVFRKLQFESRNKNNRYAFQRRCFLAAKPGLKSKKLEDWQDESAVKKMFTNHWYQKTTMLMILNDRSKRKLLPKGAAQLTMRFLEVVVEQFVFTAAYSSAGSNSSAHIQTRQDASSFYIVTYIAAVYFLIATCKSLVKDNKLFPASTAYSKNADKHNMIMRGSLWVHDLWHSLEFVKVKTCCAHVLTKLLIPH